MAREEKAIVRTIPNGEEKRWLKRKRGDQKTIAKYMYSLKEEAKLQKRWHDAHVLVAKTKK